ncbi:MAG: CoA pyrophosphatase [Chloroflexi bacterium]|nr:CoA pyrophosphatase [Chloroflexota bacterium]
MTLDDVRRALALPRPGRDAQIKMSPRPRVGDVFPVPPEQPRKNAGVLILLYPRGDALHFLLTERTQTVESHKGQISLPGGAQESGESLRDTALRETYEELNLDRGVIEILGEPLSPLYIPVSGFLVTPFVGYTATHPRVCAAPAEVVGILEPPLDWILDDAHFAEEYWEMARYSAIVPYFAINGHKVWGATAMMLSELREMLRCVQPSFA